MFLARLVRHPDDIMIFGLAIGLHHEPGRDDASPAEIRRRDWKKLWPHYVRVHHAELLLGDLGCGVSLYEMMDTHRGGAFASTQQNANNGHGNTDPRAAYRRHPQVELSPRGYQWLSSRLDNAFEEHGRLSPTTLAGLDWPK